MRKPGGVERGIHIVRFIAGWLVVVGLVLVRRVGVRVSHRIENKTAELSRAVVATAL